MPEAWWAGVLAGYAIAIPVGPIAILILETGLRRGMRIAAAAGAGAASADGFYATVAGLTGGAIAALIGPVVAPARLIGAALLAFIAVRGVAAGVGSMRSVDRSEPGPDRADGGALRTYLTFLGLTIVNPMTFLYFAALILALPVAATSSDRLVFAAGAFAASLSWQWLVALAGALLHGRLDPRFQAATRVLGSLIVLAFAARLVLAAS